MEIYWKSFNVLGKINKFGIVKLFMSMFCSINLSGGIKIWKEVAVKFYDHKCGPQEMQINHLLRDEFFFKLSKIISDKCI
jgi:hypothetical protein